MKGEFWKWGLALAWLVYGGFLGPAMISAAHWELVIGAICIGLVLFRYTVYKIHKELKP